MNYDKKLVYLSWLNLRCPVEGEWVFDEPVFKLTFDMRYQDRLTEWIESVVGCSHFYERDDDKLTVLLSYTTLEKCIGS